MAQNQRGEETRTRILDVAETCFAQQGYDATGVAEICRRAEVSKGAFYHHFSTKQALFLELLNHWLDYLDAQFQNVLAISGSVPEALLSMTEMVRPIFQERSSQLHIIFEFWMQAGHDPAVWKATIAPYQRYRAYFAQMIEEGIAEGTFRPVDADLAAQMLVSLAIGLLLQGLLDPDGADWGAVVQDSMEMFMHTLRSG